MEKLRRTEVWKLEISEKVGLEAVEAALTAACIEVAQKRYPEGAYGVLDRVDIRERETIVFISGNERTANVFSKTLEERMPHAKVAVSRVPPTDVEKLMKHWFKFLKP